MSMSFWIYLAATVVTAIFVIKIFDRYPAKGGWHLLVWGIGSSARARSRAAIRCATFVLSASNIKEKKSNE